MLLFNTFIYIFNPYILGINSIYLLCAFYLVKSAFDIKFRKILVSRIVTVAVLRVFIMALLVVFVSILVLLVHGTQDLSFVVPVLNQIFKLAIGLLLYSHFLESDETNAVLYCIYAFAIQAALQIISFFSQEINGFLNAFRDLEAVEKGVLYYGGYRGLVVGSASFFSISAAYALIFVIVAEYWNEIRLSKVSKALMLIAMVFASISAGRTAFAGMIIAAAVAIVLKFLKRQQKVKKLRLSATSIVYVYVALSLFLIVLMLDANKIISVTIDNSILQKIDSYTSYAFEFVYNYLNGRGFTTASTNILADMYFPVSPATFWLGDGMYTGEFGGYYMETDAGYMRQVLYFGVLGLTVLLVFQFMFFYYKQSKTTRIFSVSIFALLLILHYKGEVIGYLQITQCILLLRMLSQTHGVKKSD